MRKPRSSSFAIALFLTLAGCAHAAAPPSDRLVLAYRGEPETLNPLMLNGTYASDIDALAFSYLLSEDATGKPTPQVCAVVPTLANGGIARDGMTIRYRLRRDVRWSDGFLLTARDVAFTFSAIMNPHNNVASTAGFDRIESIEIPDDYTVIVHMKNPYSPILTAFLGPDGGYPVLPWHLLAKLPSLNESAYDARPIGSGPYRLERWYRGDRLLFERNPYYFGVKPAIGEIVLKAIPSEETIAVQLRDGEVDGTMQLGATFVTEVKAMRNYRVIDVPRPAVEIVSFNLNDATLRDLRLRRALAMAADWRSIVSRASQNVLDTREPMRAMFGWAYEPSAAYPKYDPKRAGALLDAAGWRTGTDGVRYREGRPLEITLGYAAGRPTDERVVTQYQAALAGIGVRLFLRAIEVTRFVATDGPLLGGHLQAAYWGVTVNGDPDPDWFLSCERSAPHGYNAMHYCNHAVDAADGAAVRTFDRANRAAYYAVVQRYLAHDLPFIPVYRLREFDVVTTRLRGFDPKLGGAPFRTVAQWLLRGS